MKKLYEAIEPMLSNLEEKEVERVIHEELEMAEDLLMLQIEETLPLPRARPGYKRYIDSPEHKLELFLDDLDAERRRRGE